MTVELAPLTDVQLAQREFALSALRKPVEMETILAGTLGSADNVGNDTTGITAIWMEAAPGVTIDTEAAPAKNSKGENVKRGATYFGPAGYLFQPFANRAAVAGHIRSINARPVPGASPRSFLTEAGEASLQASIERSAEQARSNQ